MAARTYEVIRGRRYHKLVSTDGAGVREAQVFLDTQTGRLHVAQDWRRPGRFTTTYARCPHAPELVADAFTAAGFPGFRRQESCEWEEE